MLDFFEYLMGGLALCYMFLLLAFGVLEEIARMGGTDTGGTGNADIARLLMGIMLLLGAIYVRLLLKG